jgi:hypothetical protein
MLRIVGTEVCDLRFLGTKHKTPYVFNKLLQERSCNPCSTRVGMVRTCSRSSSYPFLVTLVSQLR